MEAAVIPQAGARGADPARKSSTDVASGARRAVPAARLRAHKSAAKQAKPLKH